MKRATFIICFTFASMSVSAQQTGNQTLKDLQGSPAGSKIIKLLDFIPSGMELTTENQNEIFSERLVDKLGISGLNDIVKDIRVNDGSLILYQADRVGRYEYHTLVKSVRNDEFLKMKIYIKEGSPYTIDGFELDNVRMASPPTNVLYKPNSVVNREIVYNGLDKSEKRQLGNELEQMAKEKTFSGVVMVAEKWEPVYKKAVGQSNWETNTPNSTDTKFNIGSINKFFTSVAILQLLEEEKLGLDDPVTNYVTGFTDPRASDVTIKHLLQHQSGWTMYWDNKYYVENREDLHTIDDYMEFLKRGELAFDPGTKQQYSNTGYVVLGAVIESITGESYYDYIQKNIFNIAGMGDSGYETSVKGLAQGYTRRSEGNKDSEWRKNTALVGPIGNSAGGGYSTAADLVTFVEGVYNYKLLDKESVIMLLNGYSKEGEITDWGLGGGGSGVMALVEHDHKEGVTIVALSNIDPPSAQQAKEAIQRKLY